MSRYIKIIKKKNNLICKQYPNSNKLLILDRGRPAQIFYSSLVGILLNKKKYNVSVISDKRVRTKYNEEFYKVFGINNFLYQTFNLLRNFDGRSFTIKAIEPIKKFG